MLRIVLALLRNPFVWLGIGLLLTWVYYYNRLVKARLRVEEALSSLDNELHRRHVLIPQIRAAAGKASNVTPRITQLLEGMRVPEARLSGEEDLPGRAGAELRLSRQLHALLSELEKSGDANQHIQPLVLEEKLNEVENELQLAARYYNAIVRDYNYQLEAFPSGILAAMLDFDRAEFFLWEDAA